MRLYDKLRMAVSHRAKSIDVDSTLDALTVLACDPIAPAIYTDRIWRVVDFPFCTPPWDGCFLDWNTASESAKAIGANQLGVWVAPLKFDIAINQLLGVEKSVIDMLRSCYAVLAYAAIGSKVVSLSGMTWYLTQLGYPSVMRNLPEGNADTPGFAKAGFEAQLTALFAFSMANCKNTKLVDVTDEIQPPRKTRQRLHLSVVKRYTLKIGSTLDVPSYKSDVSLEAVNAHHLCRGHFATYTEAAPLFGKYTGQFWVPPHFRGKRENGEVIKDYEIANTRGGWHGQ